MQCNSIFVVKCRLYVTHVFNLEAIALHGLLIQCSLHHNHLSLSIHHKSRVWRWLFTGTPEQLNQGHCELYWWHWRSRHTSLPSLPCTSAAVVHHPSPHHPGDRWRVMRAAHQRPRHLALHSSANGLWSWIFNKALWL